LAVDTSSGVASAAIVEDNKLVCECVLNNKLTHSQTLMPMIESVLKKSEMTVSDIDLFVAVTGPGSFTGLRIGVSAVKALAHAANKECVGVSTLEAMAYNLPFSNALVCPIMDARRGEVYNAVYRFESERPTEIRPMRALSIDELLADIKSLDEQTVFLGDGLPVFKDKISTVLGGLALFAPANLNAQMAASAAVAAMTKETVKYNKLSPVYLRKSQAEREREEREKMK
ncbi:MAG: tRNA (adenosine(37)-N6)-threonylcarbamoyltransferase complex dimerization subunit type 1 TsaB, partial [Clostridia bacterium]|nr:tRNA (adenosine(37)-N6)-threonylcarbamoyltransferase complex dimerization subunit type 1 TsaB [Clostridia bacterium]